MNRRSSYKVTLLDKYGPEAMNILSAFKYGALVFVLSAVMFNVLGSHKITLYGFPLLAFTLVGACTLSAASMLVGLKTGETAGAGAQHVYLGGSTTPYEEQFSQEQALIMQRDYAGALHLYEQRILVTPKDVRVLIAAADLYREHGENPKRSAELYRMVQRLPDVTAGNDQYVSNKIADLYLGPLGEPGRALVEFRRLISRYPGTSTAKFARMALDNIKAELHRDPDAPPEGFSA